MNSPQNTPHVPTVLNVSDFDWNGYPVFFSPLTDYQVSPAEYTIVSYIPFQPYIDAFKNIKIYGYSLAGQLAHFLRYYTESNALGKNNMQINNLIRQAHNEMFTEVKSLNHGYNRKEKRLLEAIDLIREHPDIPLNEGDLDFKESLNIYLQDLILPESKNENLKWTKYGRLIVTNDTRSSNELTLSELGEIVILNSTQRGTISDPEIHKYREKRGISLGLLAGFAIFGLISGGTATIMSSINTVKLNRAEIDKLKGNIDYLLKRDQQNIINNQKNLQIWQLLKGEVGENRDVINSMRQELLKIDKQANINEEKNEFVQTILLNILSFRHRISMYRTEQGKLDMIITKVYGYLGSLATRRMNPENFTPHELRNILKNVEVDIQDNKALSLPYNLEDEIYKYYEIIEIAPMVTKDKFVLFLNIPLKNGENPLEVYVVHNVAIAHPTLRKTFKFRLEGEYFGITRDRKFVALPDRKTFLSCANNLNNWCSLRVPQYPTKSTNWCLTYLFNNDIEGILDHCRLDMTNYHSNTAFNFEGNTWAITTSEKEIMQVNCLDTMQNVTLQPPLVIIKMPNGCEGISESIVLPPKTSIMTLQKDLLNRVEELIFVSYIPISNQSIFMQIDINNPKYKSVIGEIVKKLPEVTKVPLRAIPGRINGFSNEIVNENIRFKLNWWETTIIGVTVTLIILVTIISILKYKQTEMITKAQSMNSICRPPTPYPHGPHTVYHSLPNLHDLPPYQSPSAPSFDREIARRLDQIIIELEPKELLKYQKHISKNKR